MTLPNNVTSITDHPDFQACEPCLVLSSNERTAKDFIIAYKNDFGCMPSFAQISASIGESGEYIGMRLVTQIKIKSGHSEAAKGECSNES